MSKQEQAQQVATAAYVAWQRAEAAIDALKAEFEAKLEAAERLAADLGQASEDADAVAQELEEEGDEPTE